MLRPFGATLSCPKCNHFATGFLREYSIGLDPNDLVKADRHLAQEHIKVTCPSCGFYWREHTADHSSPGMETWESTNGDQHALEEIISEVRRHNGPGYAVVLVREIDRLRRGQ